MAADDIAICNQALNLLRADTVTNIASPTTNEEDICAAFYSDFVNDILTRYPWSFATKKALLTATTAPTTEWTYGHTVPTEALRVWALYNSTEARAAPVAEYDIYSPSTGRVIMSEQSTLYADYTVYRDEQYWPGYFVQFAIYAFAALICIPVTDQVDTAEMLHQAAWGARNENELGGKYGVACRLDAMQKSPEFIIDSPLVTSRFS